LTPVETGRQILNGTFTHPSPIAAIVYQGGTGRKPITTLVERLDGVSLFGRPLESVGAEEFSRLAGRLRVSAVVATGEDHGRLDFLDSNPDFTPPRLMGPFRVYFAREARRLPEPTGPQSWRLALASDQRGWVSAGVAYSPLWRAESASRPAPVRRDAWGMLEVEIPGDGGEISLDHRPGPAEKAGELLTVASALLLTVAGVCTYRVSRASPPPPPRRPSHSS